MAHLYKKAVFLDRDGVIVEERNYAYRLDQLTLIKGAARAIRRFNQAGFLAVVVSNQAGVAHGIFREEDAEIFNEAMRKELEEEKARIDAIYFCPHHPEAKVPAYRMHCECRKPEPGMLLRAARDLCINLSDSIMIGDKLSDIEAGLRAGCKKSVLVSTGHGKNQPESGIRADYVAADILDAAKKIIKSYA